MVNASQQCIEPVRRVFSGINSKEGTSGHVIVVHHVPMIVEAIDMALAVQGFTVHPAQSFRDTKALLTLVGGNLVAVVAHADMPNQPQPGSLLRMVRKSHPHAALVVLSARGKGAFGRLPVSPCCFGSPSTGLSCWPPSRLLPVSLTARSPLRPQHGCRSGTVRSVDDDHHRLLAAARACGNSHADASVLTRTPLTGWSSGARGRGPVPGLALTGQAVGHRQHNLR